MSSGRRRVNSALRRRTLPLVHLDPHTIYTRPELLAYVSRRQLDRLVASGQLVVLRRGVYASAQLPEPMQRAVRAGGRLACISAAESFGLWRPPDLRVHAHFDRARSRARGEVVRHWWPAVEAGDRTRTGLLDTLAHVTRCQPRPFAVAVLDSALHGAFVTLTEIESLLERVPARHRVPPLSLDARAESGVESLIRVALVSAGLRSESQVTIPGVGRVDLLVEGRVVVEVDGRRWHDGQQSRDYARDLAAQAAGFAVVRADYAHAIAHSDPVVRAVRRALRRPRDLVERR